MQIDGSLKDNWVTRKGEFLDILVCNHFCKPTQGLLSPVIAPKAQHDDGSLDLILVHGSGRLRLFCFFVAYQFCWHLLICQGKTSKDKASWQHPQWLWCRVSTGSFFRRRAKWNGSALFSQHKADCLASIPELRSRFLTTQHLCCRSEQYCNLPSKLNGKQRNGAP